MNGQAVFQPDYTSARDLFRNLSLKLTAQLNAYPVCADVDDLSIELANIETPGARRTVIVSSGLHGVEGFAGSAIQCELLTRLIDHKLELVDCNLVLIHAINPYGMKYLRRVNEDNIDLNRNFLSDFDATPDSKGYAKFNHLLNPDSKVTRFDAFDLKAYYYITRYGLSSLRQSISAGQYDYPKGLFYGGKSAALSTRLTQQMVLTHCKSPMPCIHIDIHTGLGEFAEHKLLLIDHQLSSSKLDHYNDIFNTSDIDLIGHDDSLSSSLNGTVSDCLGRMMNENYVHLGLEFGTYSNQKILKSLRLENAAHFHLGEDSHEKKQAKANLLECFCPDDLNWREKVITDGLKVIQQALDARQITP